jgi:hypothetical protein
MRAHDSGSLSETAQLLNHEFVQKKEKPLLIEIWKEGQFG